MARRPLFKHLMAPEPALAGAILWPMAMASEPWEEEMDLELSPSGATFVAVTPGPDVARQGGLPPDLALVFPPLGTHSPWATGYRPDLSRLWSLDISVPQRGGLPQPWATPRV